MASNQLQPRAVWSTAAQLRDSCEPINARASHIQGIHTGKHPASERIIDDGKLADIATNIYRARRRRAELFGDGLFNEPGWDMLLDLFIAHVRGARVPSTSLCIAADVPTPTGLRWIEKLEARGLVSRSDTPDDRRVTLVALTGSGYRLMREYVTEGVSRAEMPVN